VKKLGRRQSNTGRSAGHQGDSAIQLLAHGFSFHYLNDRSLISQKK
jgi:hypothetical protein